MMNLLPEAPITVGLIGAGWVTQHHLAAWEKIADARVIAVCDPDIEAANTRAAQFGIAHVFSSAEQMLDAITLDAVDIASPRQTHADYVRLCSSRGIDVLCQKPLAPTLAEAQQLVHETANRMRLMVHENWRFRPYYRQIRQWLTAGRIGRPRQAVMSLFSSGMLPDHNGVRPLLQRQPFLATLDRMLVTEILIHHIDTLRFTLGELKVQHAVLHRMTPGLRGEDMASMALTGTDGVSVSLLANVGAAGYPENIVDELTILGEQGSIFLKGDTLRLTGTQEQTIHYDLPAAYQASYDATIAHFVNCRASGAAFETRPEDNLLTMEIVEDAYRLG